MSGGGRAPNRPTQPPPPPAAAAASGGAAAQIVQPLRRHLAFTSTKPPFLPPDEYHRFSGDARRVADQEPEAIVVRSPVSRVILLVFPVHFLWVYCSYWVKLGGV